MSKDIDKQIQPRKFGADSPEIADSVMNEYAARRPRPVRLIGWTAALVAFALVWGVTLLALSAAIYGLWRMTRWVISWFS